MKELYKYTGWTEIFNITERLFDIEDMIKDAGWKLKEQDLLEDFSVSPSKDWEDAYDRFTGLLRVYVWMMNYNKLIQE